MSRPAPGTRSAYCRFHPITTRWMDDDALGHINNAVSYSYFDTTISHFLVQNGTLARCGGGTAAETPPPNCWQQQLQAMMMES